MLIILEGQQLLAAMLQAQRVLQQQYVGKSAAADKRTMTPGKLLQPLADGSRCRHTPNTTSDPAGMNPAPHRLDHQTKHPIYSTITQQIQTHGYYTTTTVHNSVCIEPTLAA
jgi:hypothetical protein